MAIDKPLTDYDATRELIRKIKRADADVLSEAKEYIDERISDYPAYGTFLQSNCTADESGEFTYDDLVTTTSAGVGISVVDGELTVTKGLYHVTIKISIENTSSDSNYYDPALTVGGDSVRIEWDNSYVHKETLLFCMDTPCIQVSGTIVPSISGLPVDAKCDLESLEIHRVVKCDVAVGDVEHDSTMTGDGSIVNPLSVVIDGSLDSESSHPVENRAVKAALDAEATERSNADEALSTNKEDRLTEMTDQEVADLVDSLE